MKRGKRGLAPAVKGFNALYPLLLPSPQLYLQQIIYTVIDAEQLVELCTMTSKTCLQSDGFCLVNGDEIN